MKTLLITLVLIFFLGISIHSNSYAKVLPIIEGTELMDTLASQNNEKANLPDLSTGIYKNVELEHVFYSIEKYPSKEVIYDARWLLCISSINRSLAFLLILKPDSEFRFNKQIRFQFNLVNI